MKHYDGYMFSVVSQILIFLWHNFLRIKGLVFWEMGNGIAHGFAYLRTDSERGL